MKVKEIVKYPNSILRKKCKKVGNFDESLNTLIKNLIETMYAAPGLGLAANQIGKDLALAVIDLGLIENREAQKENKEKKVLVIANPHIKEMKNYLIFEEGCLSLPGVSEKVKRASQLVLEYNNERGEKLTLEAQGLLAITVQHEVDHLNGKLYIDKLSSLKRTLLLKEYEKLKKTKPRIPPNEIPI